MVFLNIGPINGIPKFGPFGSKFRTKWYPKNLLGQSVTYQRL